MKIKSGLGKLHALFFYHPLLNIRQATNYTVSLLKIILSLMRECICHVHIPIEMMIYQATFRTVTQPRAQS